MFDSGFGGLTVARALIDLLPAEDLVYVGDAGRYPYGPKPLDEVRRFSLQIGDWLVEEQGVKCLIVACNTAAAAALDELTGRYEIPVFGVIEPGVQALLSASESGKVGVIGTVGTISSGAAGRPTPGIGNANSVHSLMLGSPQRHSADRKILLW